ncbi:hypothetical protein AB6E79_14385 [Vibrio lentus]
MSKLNALSASNGISILVGLYFGSWVLSSGAGYGLNYLTNIIFLSFTLLTLVGLLKYRGERLVILKSDMYIFIFLAFSVMYVVSFFRDYGGVGNLVKSIMWLLPFLFCLLINNISLSRDRVLSSWFYSGVIFNVIFTFFIASFNYRIGKFYADIPGFEISSNSLSIYLIFGVVVPGLLRFKGRLIRGVLLVSPLIHFSKSHIMIYIISLFLAFFLSKRKFFTLLLLFVLLLIISCFVGSQYEYFYSMVPTELQRSLGKMLILFKVVYEIVVLNTFPDFYDFITMAGDGLRASIYQSALTNLEIAWPLGASEKEINDAFHGYDFHNMVFFFYYQLGIFGLISIMMFLFVISFRAYFSTRLVSFYVIFTVTYLVGRGLFISIDPYRFSVLVVFVFYFLKGYWKQDEIRNNCFNYESKGLSNN